MKILAIGAHTDDIELNCGGFLYKRFLKEDEIHIAVFSHLDKNIEAENAKAMKIIGVKEIDKYYYPTRSFDKYRQEILEDLTLLRKKYKPDLVLAPSPDDLHQDHSRMGKETIRAFKNSTSLVHYSHPYNQCGWKPTWYIPISEVEIGKKIGMIMCYRSQQAKIYMKPANIMSVAQMYGQQIGTEFAEAFSIWRLVEVK